MKSAEPTASTDERQVLRAWGDDELGAGNGSVGQGLSDLVVEMVRARPEVSTICDLGCGNGYLASRLGALGYSVTGVDGSDRLLSIAQTHYKSDRVEFRHAFLGPDATARLGDRGPFDLVVSVDVVEHLYRPASLIETAAAILKPGGTLVLCTPYHGYFKNLAVALLNRWDDHHHVHFDGGHIKFFSVRTLAALARPSFDVERFEFYGRFAGFRKNMICIARKRGA
jgi:2-polyprenyl-3-methyl-5-hydroxy-6-metoxy-1,4-benzoquinol methylase